ncbi:restriction endonuclease [Agrobacterium tumefaciens]|uniref:restriction endonuclease n=1 Tax=Agrobacterium tumefaciens TaxID=358 RepID=UPI0015749D03|nr:restriction endonuclease [Agrobacterium tumefaciens]NTA45365.1 restriction endonuclease [Agrobacterium tumefaciens]UXU08328.1 restriction endonuclease [Agrobacterium tumefaciens]WIE36023.1 restriction endonuclease [Agrobacterium tumefaciens]
MAIIDQTIVQGFVHTGNNGANTTVKGKALEDMICYLFGQVPGISVTMRNEMNVFETEEIDVALWNEQEVLGFPFLPEILLVECKNWSSAVGSGEVNWFDTKLRNRGLEFGILVATNGITGNGPDLTAAQKVVSDALKEKRRLIVIDLDEIRAWTDTSDIVLMLKKKICGLVVKGF